MNDTKNNVPVPPDSLMDQNLAVKISGMTKEEFIAYTLAYFVEGLDSKQKYLRGHINRFLETLSLLGQGSPDQKLLEIGSYDVFTLMLHKFTAYRIFACVYDRASSGQILKFVNKIDRHTVEYELAGFNAEKDIYPFEDGMFDIVLFCEVLEHLTQDPLFALSEINRVLKPGGRIFLTTPNIVRLAAIDKVLKGYSPYFYNTYSRFGTDRHNREFAPNEVKSLIEKGGFKVSYLATKFVWDPVDPAIFDVLHKLKMPMDLRGDNIFAIGIKNGPVLERYPQEFYD